MTIAVGEGPGNEGKEATHDRQGLSLSDVAGCRPTPGELRSATRLLRWKATGILTTALASYVTLVCWTHTILVAVPVGVVLVLSMVAIGTGVMHDANHGAFGRSKQLNQVLAYSADLLGASSVLWRMKHNGLHHANTNVEGVDTDIEQMPFARLAPSQPWHAWYRYQHIYIWALYGLLTVQWLLFSDFASLATGRIGSQRIRRHPRRRDVVTLFAGKVVHIAWALVLPIMSHAWWVVLAFYIACSWLVGFILAVFFQLAHCVDTTQFTAADAPRRGEDFVAHQLRTTANVGTRTPLIGPPIAFLMGGLNYQVEHHLAPGVPHTAYPAMARRIRDLCTTRNIEYHSHRNIFTALHAHTRWLREMGERPT